MADIDYRQYVRQELGIDADNPAQCIRAARQSFIAFCLLYLPHYFNLKPAPFHYQLFDILEDEEEDAVVIIGFRGSAKSTITSLAYPLWCAIFEKYHFIVLLNDTEAQARLNVINIKTEVEQNIRLRQHFPDLQSKTKWAETELMLSNNVYLMGRSRGQKVRGLRWRQYRPELMILDDVEALEWVRKQDNRDKTERWFDNEVVPAQEEARARMIVIGNLLHMDAFMSRLKKRGTYNVLEFPLVDENNKVTWPAKYPTIEAYRKQREKVQSQTTWLREYMLKVVPEDGQVIKEGDIHYYDNDRITSDISSIRIKPTNGGAAADLAISSKASADCTSIVGGVTAREMSQEYLYLLPNPVNQRGVDINLLVELSDSILKRLPIGSKLYVEKVGYQEAAIKVLKDRNLPVYGISPITDKRARLETAAPFIKNGQVRFPRKGCEALIQQLLGFGIEAHDDLVDALVYLILAMFHQRSGAASVERADKI